MKLTETISEINAEAELLHGIKIPNDFNGKIIAYKQVLILALKLIKLFTTRKADDKIDEIINFLNGIN